MDKIWAAYDTFTDRKAALQVEEVLRKNHPEWYVRTVLIRSTGKYVVQWTNKDAS